MQTEDSNSELSYFQVMLIACFTGIMMMIIGIIIGASKLNDNSNSHPVIFASTPVTVYRTDVCINTDTNTYAYFKTEYNNYLGSLVTFVGENGDLVFTAVSDGEIKQQIVYPMHMCRWEQKK